ncbi:MAG TPA: aldolase [Sedimenticola thiotaurini]|uniref:Aldolase n=1 Tax=Sedimenticola thiotaurini TaxID=1543721 RepID=A0A831RMD5_9GAMM|nr:aldolase [Sedimenticola thiotaurini]
MSPLELLLFTTDPAFARRAEQAGIDGFIVDWECKGKGDRQRGFDMEVNADTPEDVAMVAQAVERPVIVRINGPGDHTPGEIELALDCGAGGLMLPMATDAGQVARFLDQVAGRARTIVQVETQPLVEDLDRFATLGWDAAYIGLHDLMLSRSADSMWRALLDGTVERIFRTLSGRDVGFAGATVIGGGHPIRFTQILQELSRLGARLTFLRRSFKREIEDREMGAEIAAVRAAWEACNARGAAAVASDREVLYRYLRQLVGV